MRDGELHDNVSRVLTEAAGDFRRIAEGLKHLGSAFDASNVRLNAIFWHEVSSAWFAVLAGDHPHCICLVE